MHRLSDKDLVAKTATCLECGPGTPIRFIAHKNYWACKIAERTRNIRSRRGHTPVDYQVPREGECEICGNETEIFWDHDHRTGAHRGWLCRDCNLALGYLKDDPDRARKAAAYLER